MKKALGTLPLTRPSLFPVPHQPQAMAAQACHTEVQVLLVPLQLQPSVWCPARLLLVKIQPGHLVVSRVQATSPAPAMCGQQGCPTPHLSLDDVPGILKAHVVLCVVQQQAVFQVLPGILIHLSG